MCKEHNGWTNKPTWAVKLWLDNDEGSYNYWQEQAQRLSAYKLADQLKEEIEQGAAELLPEASLYTDLLLYSLHSVNFDEIAQAIKADQEAG